MPFATVQQVQAVLSAGSGGLGTGDWDGVTDLTPFIDMADVMVLRVQAMAPTRPLTKGVGLSVVELTQIEINLAAHYYVMSDLKYQQKTTGKSSATFQGKTEMGLDASFYGQSAKRLDASGALTILDKRQVAGGFFAGVRGATMYGRGWAPACGTSISGEPLF